MLHVYLQKFISDAQEGIGKVEDGKAVAHVLIPENFTDNYFQRYNNDCYHLCSFQFGGLVFV